LQHSQHSDQDLSINGTIPEVVEVSFGVERLMLAILEDSYQKEIIKNTHGEEKEREVLKLPPLLAPYFVAIIPVPTSKQKKGLEIQQKAYQLYCELLPTVNFSLTYEETDNIGKSYRRQDAIGTYYCLTVDFSTVDDQSPDYNTLTCRQRDTMEQVRINIDTAKNYLNNKYEKYFQEFAK